MVNAGSMVQESIAINRPSSMTILLNRYRWQAEKDLRLKGGIALHEVVSLAGLETTGFYPISSRYIDQLGLDSQSLKLLPDGHNTYMSCLDTESGLALVSVGPKKRDPNSGLGGTLYNRVGIELRNLVDPSEIQALAKNLGLDRADEVRSVSFGMPSRAASNGSHGFDLCFFDLFDRAKISCENTAFGSQVTTGITFKTEKGELIKTQTNTAAFSISGILRDKDGTAKREVKATLSPGGSVQFYVKATSCSN